MSNHSISYIYPFACLALYTIAHSAFLSFVIIVVIGISNDSHIITYDFDDNFGLFSSPRVWWMFRYFGHKAVSVLDGGFQTWLNAGLAVESGEPKPLRSKCSTIVAKITNDIYRGPWHSFFSSFSIIWEKSPSY
jgi:hypothetical protein